MNLPINIDKRTLPFIFLLFVSLFFGLLLRTQTILDLQIHGYPIVLYEDPWYSIRQIEQIMPHFPSYAWFDPFLNYPDGKNILWGPVFPIFGACISLLFGASTQSEIIRIVSWIPLLVFVMLVPVCYLIGKTVWNRHVGFLSVILICFVSGEFLFRTQYGYVDHHCLEVLFLFGFFAVYILTLKEGLSKNTDASVIKKGAVILSTISGLIFYLGIMNMPTMLISGIIVSIFTLLYSLSSKSVQSMFRLVQVHVIIFGLFSILYYFYGLIYPGFNLREYSAGLIIVALLLILGTAFLYILQTFVQKYTSHYWNFYIIIGFFLFLFICVLHITGQMPNIMNSFNVLFSDLYSFTNISELKPMPIPAAISQYNLGLILSIIGFYFLIKKYIKEQSPIVLVLILSSIILTYISFNQIRYQYYEGPIIALLSAIALERLYSFFSMRFSKIFVPDKYIIGSHFRDKARNFKRKIPLLILGIIIVSFVIFSSYATISYLVIVPKYSISDEKVQSLLWLEKNSPDPGIDYYSIYDKGTFEYPNSSYSILNWWGDGHYVVALSKRMPIATPLQDEGAYASTAFYLAHNESVAENIIKMYNSAYVIVDNDLYAIYSKIGAWVNNPLIKDDQVKELFSLPKDGKNELKFWNGMTDSFFESMMIRLYQFDGSAIFSEEQNNITYVDVSIGGTVRSIIVANDLDNKKLNIDGIKGEKQYITVSFNSTHSTVDVPALSGYRLIYESPKINPSFKDKEIHNLKIFERVKGYTIPGTGTIEVPIVTNQGRHFTYRQQSENGTFTLPYATTNSPYDVRATGPYRIIETNKTFDVDESQIEKYYT